MTQATDFTPEEWYLLRLLPIMVSFSSLMIIYPHMTTILDASISVSSGSLRRRGVFSAIRHLPTTLKAVKMINNFASIWIATGNYFPENECIQAIQADPDMLSPDFNLHGFILRRRTNSFLDLRDEMCEQAITTLSQKSPFRESEEYRRWLLQIAKETMRRGRFHGFLRGRKGHGEAKITQSLQDFATILHLSSEKDPF